MKHRRIRIGSATSLGLLVALSLFSGCVAASPHHPVALPGTLIASSRLLPQVVDYKTLSQQQGGGKSMQTTQLFTLHSPAFDADQSIPAKFTCDGANVSPTLQISNLPEKTKTFALVMDDPDAPGGTFTHWLLWNIPATVQSIAEDRPPREAMEGLNSFQQIGYGGPCPPSGTHHYRFKLYALDSELNLPQGAGVKDLERAIRPHVLAESILVGTYHRK